MMETRASPVEPCSGLSTNTFLVLVVVCIVVPMAYDVLTLQRWNEYVQKKVVTPMTIVNAALVPYLDSLDETSVVAVVNGEKTVLCTLKPYHVESKALNFRLERENEVVLFLDGANEIDLLIEMQD